MIGERAYGGRKYWLQALGFSLFVHVAAASTFVDWQFPAQNAAPAATMPKVEVIPIGPDIDLPAPEIVEAEEIEVATLTPVTPEVPEAITANAVTALPPEEASPLAVTAPSEGAVIQPQLPGALTSITAQPLEPSLPDETTIASLPPDSGLASITNTPDPLGAAISELVSSIQESRGDACLLAVPRTQPDGSLSLTVMAADDRSIADFIDKITAATDAPLTPVPVLLDRRQCPAITWLRASPRYPATGLSVTLASGELASGDHVQGRIDGGQAKQTITLLMIDDDGVVQDAGRFLQNADGTSSFDAKVSRNGASRDTGIILLALATPAEPPAISAEDGKTAKEFFAALEADAAPGTSAGAAAFTLR